MDSEHFLHEILALIIDLDDLDFRFGHKVEDIVLFGIDTPVVAINAVNLPD